MSEGWEHRGCHFLEELTLDQDLEKLIDVGMWKRKKGIPRREETAGGRRHGEDPESRGLGDYMWEGRMSESWALWDNAITCFKIHLERGMWCPKRKSWKLKPE